MESEWFDYVGEIGVGENQGRRKKHKSNLEHEDVDHPIPDLPCVAAEMVFFGDDEYQPDRPWKNSGVERAIEDALDDWVFTDSSMEGDMIQNMVSLECNVNENIVIFVISVSTGV
jgi:hypothetical protein